LPKTRGYFFTKKTTPKVLTQTDSKKILTILNSGVKIIKI